MTPVEESKQKRSGYVAVVGRPNVGKSTLINHLLGFKLSITSRKPQTTRHVILGIKTTDAYQMIFVDTPGIHKNRKSAMNRMINKSALAVVHDVDVIAFVIDGTQWTEEDELVLNALRDVTNRVVLVLNKVDKLKDKTLLLRSITEYQEKTGINDIVPVSALHNQNLDRLESAVAEKLPADEFIYPEDQLTDKSQRFMVAEIIREKIVRLLGDEIPYQTTVEIEEFKDKKTKKGKTIINISALILVEKEGQKRIIIGNDGDKLKKIGSLAREDIEALLDSQVMLKLWVKIKSGWADNEKYLRSLKIGD